MSPKKEKDPQLAEISGKLDVLIRVSALNLVRGMETQKEKIAALSDASFGPKQIAEVLLTNSNVVSVALNKIRKERANLTREEQGTTTSSDVKEAMKDVAETTDKTQA